MSFSSGAYLGSHSTLSHGRAASAAAAALLVWTGPQRQRHPAGEVRQHDCRGLATFGERSPHVRSRAASTLPPPAGPPADRLRADAARPSTTGASCRRGPRKCPVGRIEYRVLPRVLYRLTMT